MYISVSDDKFIKLIDFLLSLWYRYLMFGLDIF